MDRQNLNDGITSPTLSISSVGETNKSDAGKSPTKLKKSPSTASSTNLDKVIEAVSKGILDDNQEPSIELKRNHNEVSPAKSPKLNGVQVKLNDSKSSIESPEKSVSPIKVKANKKAKKEKDRTKDKDKTTGEDQEKKEKDEKVEGKQKEKDKINKDKDKDKAKETDKDKTKSKEKVKRKPSVKSDDDLNMSPVKIGKIKEEKHKPNEMKFVENVQPEVGDSLKQIKESHVELARISIPIDSITTTEINLLKNPQLTEHIPVNGDATVADNISNDRLENAITSTTTTTTAIEKDNDRKQSRKRRKEKHRNKHGQDTERSSSKEHKKKRKRKNHDHENPEHFPMADGVPKIKIKVCILYIQNKSEGLRLIIGLCVCVCVFSSKHCHCPVRRQPNHISSMFPPIW